MLNTYLNAARDCLIAGENNRAVSYLESALYLARQLPSKPKTRALRGYIVTGIEAIRRIG